MQAPGGEVRTESELMLSREQRSSDGDDLLYSLRAHQPTHVTWLPLQTSRYIVSNVWYIVYGTWYRGTPLVVLYHTTAEDNYLYT